MNGDLVREFPELLFGTSEILKDLEAVDDDKRGVHALDVFHEKRDGLLKTLAPHDAAQVNELNVVLFNKLWVKVAKLFEVSQRLGRWFRESLKDQSLFLGRRVMKNNLLRQNRFPSARRTGNNDERF